MTTEAKKTPNPMTDAESLFRLIQVGTHATVYAASQEIDQQSEAIRALEEVVRLSESPFIGSHLSI